MRIFVLCSLLWHLASAGYYGKRYDKFPKPNFEFRNAAQFLDVEGFPFRAFYVMKESYNGAYFMHSPLYRAKSGTKWLDEYIHYRYADRRFYYYREMDAVDRSPTAAIKALDSEHIGWYYAPHNSANVTLFKETPVSPWRTQKLTELKAGGRFERRFSYSIGRSAEYCIQHTMFVDGDSFEVPAPVRYWPLISAKFLNEASTYLECLYTIPSWYRRTVAMWNKKTKACVHGLVADKFQALTPMDSDWIGCHWNNEYGN